MIAPDQNTAAPDTIATEHPELWRWYAIGMLAAGGAAVELILATPTVSSREAWVPHAVAIVFLLLGSLILALGRHAERYLIQISGLIIFVTTIQIAMLVAVADGVPGLPFFFLWPLLSASYLFSRRRFIAVVGFAAVAYAIALLPAFQGVPFPAVNYALTAFAALIVLIGSRALNQVANELFMKLREVAEIDQLTRLHNRRSFYEKGDHLLKEAVTRGHGLALLSIDLDHFKAINDTFGHSVGDTALSATGDLLNGMFPAPHLAARMGGEEFVVLLPGASLDQALERAVGFRNAIRESDALPDAVITASVGVAMLQPGRSLEALLADGDAAAYQAKASGRDTVSLHGSGISAQALRPSPSVR